MKKIVYRHIAVVLIVAAMFPLRAGAAVYTINVNMNWSDIALSVPPYIAPGSADVIDVMNGVRLNVDVPNAQCGSIDIGSSATLAFAPGSQLTVGASGNGTVTLGSNGLNGFIDMLPNTILNCGDLVPANINNMVFTALAGDININTNTVATLPAAAYQRLTLSGGGIVQLDGDISVIEDLTIGSGTTLDAMSSAYTIIVDGNWINDGVAILNNSTVTFGGTTTQDIGGSASTSFHNLEIANSTVPVTAGQDISISNSISIGNGAIFTPGASYTISGAGFLTGSGTVKVTRATGNNDFAGQYTLSGKVLTNLTVEFAGTATQGNGTAGYSNMVINNSHGVNAGANLSLSSVLTLQEGHYNLNNYDLTMQSGALFAGGSSDSYVRVNGTGRVIVTNIGTVSHTLPIGYNPYLPVTVSSPSGNVDFIVGVINGITDSTGTAMTQDAVNRTWEITPSANVSGVEITLQWPTAEELSGFNRTACFIIMRDMPSNPWVQTQMSGVAGNPSGGIFNRSSTITTQMNGGTTYHFGMSSSLNPLPVSLISFTGSYQDHGAVLHWITAMEKNNHYFDVQRSSDAKSWRTIGQVSGAGNSNKIETYSYTDRNHLDKGSVAYYRLIQVDFNGAHAFSDVISIRAEGQAGQEPSMDVFPNPSLAGDMRIMAKAIPVGSTVRLISPDGKLVAEQVLSAEMSAGFRLSDIAPEALRPGIYILNITGGNSSLNKTIHKL